MDKKQQEGFDALTDLWQQGQEAFLRAQSEIAEQFNRSLKDMGGGHSSRNDPMAAWNDLIKAWTPFWNPASSGGFATTTPDFDFRYGQNGFFELLDPQKWTRYAPEQLRLMLEKIAKGPQFADLVMPQQGAAEAWRETLDYQQAASEMSQVMQNAWVQAYRSFTENYSLEDLQSGNVDEALQGWLKSANEALLETQGSDEFLEAQKQMIRASTEIRARQKDMAESWSEAWQMPTRTEVDDLTLMVYQLRRELREVKRELANLKGNAK